MELFDVNQLSNGVYCISENYYQSWNKANMYLFVSENESILVDTGTGLYNPVPLLISKGIIQNEPKAAIATHVHYDHAGGHHFFQDFYLHSNDAEALQTQDELKSLPFIAKCELTQIPPGFEKYEMKPRQDFKVLEDGMTLSIGNETLEIIHLPGHTPGSIGVLHQEKKLLCTGDMLFSDFPMLDCISGQGSKSDFEKSMEKILKLISEEKVRRSILLLIRNLNFVTFLG